jgi:hypothetical protein
MKTLPQTKIGHVLAHLTSGASLNRQEAELEGNQWLKSKVAVLANRHNLHFQLLRERAPNRFGTLTESIRYKLPADQRHRAMSVLSEPTRTNSED